jgi:hypothetical protein
MLDGNLTCPECGNLGERVFRCVACEKVVDIDDLPRVTLQACIAGTRVVYNQLLCYADLKTLVDYLHLQYCPLDCGETHEVR